jgi:hypothetical protein
MPSNDMLTRYLQAVGFWLPRETKEDILAEISEDLQSQMDERAASLGRPLKDDEVAEILKKRGRPSLVAGSFLPQRQLIGPVLYPIYVFVLAMVGLCYFVPWLLVWLGYVIFDPSYGALRGLGTLWTVLWIVFGVVTFIFAVLDRTSNRAKFVSEWDPSKLPKTHQKQRNRRREDIGACVFGILYLGWLLAVPTFPFLALGPAALSVTAAPVWHSVYPFFLILAVAGLAEPTLSLFLNMPAWERPVFRLAQGGFCLWVIGILRHAPTCFIGRGLRGQEYAAITNLIVYIVLVGVTVGLSIALIVEAIKFIYSLVHRPTPAVPRTA